MQKWIRGASGLCGECWVDCVHFASFQSQCLRVNCLDEPVGLLSNIDHSHHQHPASGNICKVPSMWPIGPPAPVFSTWHPNSSHSDLRKVLQTWMLIGAYTSIQSTNWPIAFIVSQVEVDTSKREHVTISRRFETLGDNRMWQSKSWNEITILASFLQWHTQAEMGEKK